MALHRWERFLRVSFSMFLIFYNFFYHIFGISTIDSIQKASSNVQFRGPLSIIISVQQGEQSLCSLAEESHQNEEATCFQLGTYLIFEVN